jgi:photosystem II stability/assembly factor-like uncharacterized protein
MKKLSLIIVLTSILLGTGCKKDVQEENKPDPKPNGTIIISENTKILDQQTRSIITSIDTASYTIKINGNNSFTSSLKVGDILVDSTSAFAPYGYLRKVKSINNSKDDEITVVTEPASLTEAISKGKINFSTGKLNMSQVERYELADGVTMQNLKNTDFTVFSMDYEKKFENENGKVTITGHTDLDMEFFFDFDWDFDWLAVPPQPVVEKFESGIEINQSASIMMISEAGAGINERISLGKFYFTPWTFMVGPVPVVFVPRVELFIEMDGSIVAVFTASASENFEGRLGTSYSDADGWGKIEENSYNKDYVAPNLTAGAEFTTHIGPEVSLLLYGISGPFVNFTACSNVDASLQTATQNWDLTFLVGVQAEVGVLIDIIGFSNHWTPNEFCLFSDTLMYLSDEPFGNNIYISYPVDGQSYLVGNDIHVTTSYTGETPDEVEFIYDYNLVYTDTEEPFEFVLNTDGEPDGGHVIRVNAKLGGVEIASDYSSFNMVIPVWDIISLSDLGLNENTNANDLFFINTTDGWMTVDAPAMGKVLKTTDSGKTWSEIYSSTTPLLQVKMFNEQGQGIFLDAFGKVMYSTEGGHTMVQLTYGQFNQPSFQWKKIFGFTTNNEGEIVAVGKDTGIPYQYSIYRADIASHNPTGYFNLPYPNEYGTPPKIVMSGNSGFLYDVYNEDVPSKSYYLTTTDGGKNWNGFEFDIVDANAQLYGAYMPDETHVWIVGEDNDGAIVVMSDNGGESWTKVSLSGTPAFSSVYFTSNNEGYATVKDRSDEFEAKLFHTLDGGHTWQPMIETRAKYGMSKVFFLGQDFGVVCGKGSQIFRYSVEK